MPHPLKELPRCPKCQKKLNVLGKDKDIEGYHYYVCQNGAANCSLLNNLLLFENSIYSHPTDQMVLKHRKQQALLVDKRTKTIFWEYFQ